MKLLHVANRYPPYGSGTPERQARLLVNELAGRGHLNRVLTSDHVVDAVPDREAFAQRRLRVAPADRRQPMPFHRVLLNERQNLRALREELDELHPDVVVVWNLAGLSNNLVWEVERRGIPWVLGVFEPWPRHRLREDPWMQWWSAPLGLDQRVVRKAFFVTGAITMLSRRLPMRRLAEGRVGGAFFASRALRESIGAAGYRVDGGSIIPYCLGRDEFPGAPQRREDPRRLLWVGRLDADRDPLTAIQAIQDLRHRGDMRFSLDIFGRGEVAFESRLHDYVRDAQLAGAVTIRHTNAEDLTALFSSYDIFLFTARHPEPFPLRLLRAMAARLPVVSTVEGSCADVVRAGENALTFRTGDPADCARRITQLCQEREAAEQMVQCAYRDVLDNYSVLTVAGRFEQFLSEVVPSRSAERFHAVAG